jgi:hypothetical protein
MPYDPGLTSVGEAGERLWTHDPGFGDGIERFTSREK